MSSKSVKYERILEEKDLTSLLETLGTVMQIETDPPLNAEGFIKIKLSVTSDFGQTIAKLKISHPGPKCEGKESNGCISPSEELIKYSKLKKRMKKTFKVIKTNLSQDQLPPKEAVDSFLDDSDTMVCYPGYGDEFYLNYTKIVRSFTKAWEKKDLAALRNTAEALDESKSQCHDKYK